MTLEEQRNLHNVEMYMPDNGGVHLLSPVARITYTVLVETLNHAQSTIVFHLAVASTKSHEIPRKFEYQFKVINVGGNRNCICNFILA